MQKIALLTILFLTSLAFGQIPPTLDDIWIPMRDGENLQADVYIPSGVDSAQVILVQTPYNKNLFSFGLPMGIGSDLDDQPFIWVIVDWRGFYGSLGAAVVDPNRGEDGYDVCEWISEQVWHRDRIGTWGPSALGGIQYQTARENHPNHTCAVPIVATGHQDYDSYFYGGVLEEARLDQLDALGYGLSTFVLGNHYDSFIWELAAAETWYPSILTIPTLQIGGWYDHNSDKMMRFYEDSRSLAAVDVTDEQWLLMGPWVHGGTGIANVGSATQGELMYANAALKNDTMAWDFFNYYLLDADNGWDETSKITYYEMGKNTWQTSDEASIESLTTDKLYLQSTGRLGASVSEGSTTYTVDPENPSPTIGGATLSTDLEQGPYDQTVLDDRTDVTTFKSEPFLNDVSISGRVQVKLFISSDQPDCDIAIRLVDHYPDGRNMLITDGIKRMRFRNNEFGEADELFMEEGEVYEVTVELPFTNYTWKTGHALKIYVSGNNAIRFNVNLQNGGEMYVDGEGNIANITVHHDENYASHVILPGNNPTLSLNEENRTSFSIYPNPVRGDFITISGQGLQHYSVYDLTGNLLLNESSSASIDISTLASGVYIVQLISQTGQKEQKRIVRL